MFLLYRVNRSVEASSLSYSSGIKSENMFVFDVLLTCRVDMVISSLSGEYPVIDAFLRENSARLVELCQSGWMLRLIEVSCKEQSMGKVNSECNSFSVVCLFLRNVANSETMAEFP